MTREELETDFLIVGAGIVGLSLARELLRVYPGARIAVLEKENEIALHASGRNSGVLHAGFYYGEDTLKAKLTVSGNREMTEYCLENGLPLKRTGKVVVATSENEINGIYELKHRGDQNGVKLQIIDEKQLEEIEKNAKTCEKALFSPTTSVVEPKTVCRDIVSRFPENVRLAFDTPFLDAKGRTAHTKKCRIRFSHLFNAAGLYADKVSQSFGAGKDYTLIPFKGVYLVYNDDSLIKTQIYPVPNLKNPFLGVHFTKTVHGRVKIGPTAIPAFWRENYDFKSRFCPEEFREILWWEIRLFLGNDFNFRDLAIDEMKKYYRDYFIGQSTRLVKQIDRGNFGKYLNPGIRAQLLNKKSRNLEMDFVVEQSDRSTHILNAVSPAFTSAFSFARYVVSASKENIRV